MLRVPLGSHDEERIVERADRVGSGRACRARRDRLRRRNPLPQRAPGAAPQQARHRDFVSSQVLFADARDEAVRVLPRHPSDGRRQADRAIPEAGGEPTSGEAHDRSRRGRGARGTRRAVRPPLREPSNATSTIDVPRGRALRQRLETAFLGLNERIWRRLPARARDLRPFEPTALAARAGRVVTPTGRCTWEPISPEPSGARIDAPPVERRTRRPRQDRGPGLQHRRRGLLDRLDPASSRPDLELTSTPSTSRRRSWTSPSEASYSPEASEMVNCLDLRGPDRGRTRGDVRLGR